MWTAFYRRKAAFAQSVSAYGCSYSRFPCKKRCRCNKHRSSATIWKSKQVLIWGNRNQMQIIWKEMAPFFFQIEKKLLIAVLCGLNPGTGQDNSQLHLPTLSGAWLVHPAFLQLLPAPPCNLSPQPDEVRVLYHVLTVRHSSFRSAVPLYLWFGHSFRGVSEPLFPVRFVF